MPTMPSACKQRHQRNNIIELPSPSLSVCMYADTVMSENDFDRCRATEQEQIDLIEACTVNDARPPSM